MKNDQLLLDRFLSHHTELAIDTIEKFKTKEIVMLVEDLPPQQGLTIMSKLPPYKAGEVLGKLQLATAEKVIQQLPISIGESILRVCQKSVRSHILKGIHPEKAKYLRRALRFRSDQVGAHLEPYVFTLFESMKITEAIQLINKSKAVVRPQLFILDKEKNLKGYIEVHELLTKQKEKSIRSCMRVVPRTASPDMQISDLLEHWDDAFLDLPVVRVSGEFIGIVSRTTLENLSTGKRTPESSVIKAGNALGELYFIGLTSLLGSAETNQEK